MGEHPARSLEVDAGKMTQGVIAVSRRPRIDTSVMMVVIPFTTPELTRVAVRHAMAWADLNVYVYVIDIEVVPLLCPLDQPPVNKEFAERRLLELIEDTGLRGHGQVIYTRDRFEGFLTILEPKSLVVMATRKRWWPTRESTLARFLTKGGHQVMLLLVR